MERRTVIGALRALHGGKQLLWIEQVGDNNLSTGLPQALAARIMAPYNSARTVPLFKQLAHYSAAGLAGSTGNEDQWLGHRKALF